MARPRPYLHTSPPRLTGAGALPVRDADGRPLIRLQTLGAATILVGEVRLTAAAGTLFSLLLRLTFTPGMQLARDVLRRSLWPDQEDTRQRANLRQALYKLRGYGVQVTMQGDVVLMDAGQVVRTFSLDRSTETFARDVTLGHEPFGPFLPGFSVPWPELQEWIDQQREAVHADVRRVLSEQLRRRRERADWGGADALARWLLQFDPLNEEATLTVAECTALSGSKREAIAILDRYLAELGPAAGDIRLQATMLRRRIAEPVARNRLSFAPTERHFVGRDAELADLTLAMRRARWHDGSAVLLHGAPGIGKSRLAHELEKVAVIEGVRVVQASCRESDLLRPLSVFLDLVPDLLNRPGALGCAPESLAALRRLVPSERAGTAMNSAGATPESGEASTAAADEPVVAREPMPMAAALRRALIDLLAALSDEKPVLMIVDDVHWIDEHSWDVLSDLIDRTEAMRLFLLLTSREPHARPSRPQRVPLSLRVQALPPLSAESCLELSRAIGEDLSAPVSDELGAWFVSASEGIPLFLRALVNHWIETGEAGGVPPTLQGVIEQRLSQVSGDALRVLQTAALLGKWATGERVARVLELSASELLGCVEQLDKIGSLVSSPRAIASHELVDRASRQMLTPTVRATIHQRAAEVLRMDAEESGDTELLLASLDHIHLSGDQQLLLATTVRYIPQIASVGVPCIGLAVLERIALSSASVDDRMKLASARAKLLLEAGEYTRVIEDPLRDAHLPDAPATLTEPEIDRALSLVDSSYRADPLANRTALAAFVLAVAELPTVDRAIRLRATDIGLIISSNECDELSASRMFAAAAITEAEIECSDICQRAAILFHTMFGSSRQARQIAERLYHRALESPHTSNGYQDAMRAGFSLRLVGAGTEHIDPLKLAFRIAESVSSPLHSLNAAWHLAQSYIELNDRSNLDQWLWQVRRLYEGIDDPIVCNFAVGLYCRNSIELRDEDAARSWLEAFTRNLPKVPSLKLSSYVLSLKVAVHLLDENWQPTPDMLSTLLSRQAKIGRFGTSDFLTSVTVQALDRSGRADEAASVLRHYRREQRREVSPLGARLASIASELEARCGPI